MSNENGEKARRGDEAAIKGALSSAGMMLIGAGSAMAVAGNLTGYLALIAGVGLVFAREALKKFF